MAREDLSKGSGSSIPDDQFKRLAEAYLENILNPSPKTYKRVVEAAPDKSILKTLFSDRKMDSNQSKPYSLTGVSRLIMEDAMSALSTPDVKALGATDKVAYQAFVKSQAQRAAKLLV